MNKIEEAIKNHYTNIYIEDERFNLDRSHNLEFLTTTRYIDKYLGENNRILEVGAGTGAYSIHYASKGYQVDSVELVDNNLNILKSKITDNMNINAIQGNAIDLSMYNDNTFDVTLVLGPLYHLFDEESKLKAISEAIRVTKKEGLIFIAYITNDSVIVRYYIEKGHMDEFSQDVNNNCILRDDFDEVFSVFTIDNFKSMMNKFNLGLLHNLTTDGITPLISEYIENMTEEEYNKFLEYHFATCERYDLQGYANHMLYVAKK